MPDAYWDQNQDGLTQSQISVPAACNDPDLHLFQVVYQGPK